MAPLDPKLEGFVRSAQHIPLSAEDLRVGREMLIEHMALHRADGMLKKNSNGWLEGFMRWQGLIAAAVVISLIGGGLSYAAEYSLPGDPLYGLKLHVNERVREALAVTPQAEVKLDIQTLERRIAETKVIEAKPELLGDEKRATMIQATYKYTVEHRALDKKVEELKAKGNAEAAGILDARLNAYRDAANRIKYGRNYKRDQIINQQIKAASAGE